MATLSKLKQNEIDRKIDEVLLSINCSYPENNMLDIVSRLGIEVYIHDFDDEISGAIKWPEDGSDESPEIFLSSTNGKERQNFTLAHELGHYFLHKSEKIKFRVDRYNYASDSDEVTQETEANYFAASLLMPRDRFLDIVKLSQDINAVAKYFGVSESAVRTRLRWLRV